MLGGMAGGEGGMWEEVVGASLWISEDFHKILMDFLHGFALTCK